LAKKLIILGAGESGVGTALLAKQKGYDVFVSDGSVIQPVFQKELEEHQIEFESGSHSIERILAADEVMKSPGIPDKNDLVKAIVAKGIPIISEIEFGYRYKGHSKIAAITGSNGKTTSKELIYAVLSSHFKTYTTQGNLNNHIGVPLTILSIPVDAEMAVIEMGANHQKEIESYCAYTLPTHGVITNCGKAHLEGFGGIEGVRKGKGELYDFIRANNGLAFVYADYDYLQPMSAGIQQKVFYGETQGLVQGKVLSNEPFLEVAITEGLTIDRIHSQLVGDYNLPNILCAATIGKFFGVPDSKIKSAIEAYAPSNSRSQLIVKESNHIILDAYNANPTSMKAAIENFAHIQSEKKILMLGAMMEMGEASLEEHKNLVSLIKSYQWEAVVLVGGDFKHIDHPFVYLDNALQARDWFNQQHFENAYILIKGSRSFKMESVISQ